MKMYYPVQSLLIQVFFKNDTCILDLYGDIRVIDLAEMPGFAAIACDVFLVIRNLIIHMMIHPAEKDLISGLRKSSVESWPVA